MIDRWQTTLRAWRAFGATGVCVVAVAALWILRPPHRTVISTELAALTAEYEQLRDMDDTVLASLRARLRQRVPGQRVTLQSLAPEISADWTWRVEENGGAVLTRRAMPLAEWPGLLALLERLDRPGIKFVAISIAADGAGEARQFADIRVALIETPAATNDDPERTAPSRGPLRVVSADEPDPSRPLGPVTSLHRPDASAKPPAFGPASASFRPDPPESGTGAAYKTQTTENP